MSKPLTQYQVLTEGNGACEIGEHMFRPLSVDYERPSVSVLDYHRCSSLYCERCGETIEVVSKRE